MPEQTMGEEKLTPRENLQIALWSLPFTVGGFWLLHYLDGVDKVGWIWWPALLATTFSTGLTAAGFVSLVGHWLGSVTKRTGGLLGLAVAPITKRIGELLGLAVVPVIERIGRVLGMAIVYLAIAAFYVWLAVELFGILGNLNRGTILAFFAGGIAVYVMLRHRNE
jgi:hypothetical protein